MKWLLEMNESEQTYRAALRLDDCAASKIANGMPHYPEGALGGSILPARRDRGVGRAMPVPA